MLNFITIKKTPKFEFRLYVDSNPNIEGIILYRGHKLGVSEKLLLNLIEFKMEKSTNRLYLMDYQTKDNWFISSNSSQLIGLNKSYESLLSKLESIEGKFRKIVITRV